MNASRLPRLSFVAVVTVLAALLWSSLPGLGHAPWVWDNLEYQDYVQRLGTLHHIPGPENYEYTLPPGLPAAAALSRGVAKAIGPVDAHVLGGLPHGLRALGWVLLVLVAAWLLSAGRLRLGAAVAAVAAVLAALDVVSAATSVWWLAYDLPDLVSVLGLVVVAGLLAHEVWPRWRWAPPLAAFATASLPVVFRGGALLHPDPPFALFAAAALLVALRANRVGWTARSGVAAGALLAAAAWTRQSAVVVVVVVGIAALLLGGAGARRWLVGAAAALVLLAGPWWGYQGAKYGNPIKSNLDRPGLMLGHQPLDFFVAVPREIVTDPWQLLRENLLLPRFHVDLWSNWAGTGGYGGPDGTEAKALAISQTVLGFGGDALVLGGIAFLGVPALLRVVRRRTEMPEEAALGSLTLLFLAAWAAYVTMLVRFPQRGGDPNQAHYLLFLAPAAAVLGLAAARFLWRRGRLARWGVAGWAVAYCASWGAVLSLMA